MAAKPRKKAKRSPRNWPRIRRNIGRAFVVFGVTGFIWWFFAADIPGRIQQALLNATADGGLKVENILIEGRGRTSQSAIKQALKIKEGEPILGFDPHEARLRLLELPWIAEARVERRAPATIYVGITEHTPIAVWQHEQKLYLLNNAGEAISEKAPGEFESLLVIVGAGAPTHLIDLLQLMSLNPGVKARVTAAVWVGDRRWNLILDRRIEVRLPEENVATAWRHLVRVLNSESMVNAQTTRIDLRLPDRIIMKNADTTKEFAP